MPLTRLIKRSAGNVYTVSQSVLVEGSHVFQQIVVRI
jgi:hypothetical protein